jgi:hypothetical protein
VTSQYNIVIMLNLASIVRFILENIAATFNSKKKKLDQKEVKLLV